MKISFEVPDCVVNAVAGKGAVILTGAVSAGVMHGLGMLAQHSPALVSLCGDPTILADRITVALGIGIAYAGNALHVTAGSPLGERVAVAAGAKAEEMAAADLSAHGIAPPALPVLSPAPDSIAGSQPSVAIIDR